jgi:hypothetical protein
MAQASNTSHQGGRDKDYGSRTDWAKSLWDPSSANKSWAWCHTFSIPAIREACIGRLWSSLAWCIKHDTISGITKWTKKVKGNIECSCAIWKAIILAKSFIKDVGCYTWKFFLLYYQWEGIQRYFPFFYHVWKHTEL